MPHWFEDLADHLGGAYLRYSFTRGTEQEADALVDALRLVPGERVLDVGCGPGRHARALAARGLRMVGVDVSARFLELAAAEPPGPGHGATGSVGSGGRADYVRADARHLPVTGAFDAAISLCQGGFGLLGGPGSEGGPPDPDGAVLEQMAAALRPGGRLAVSAFSAYFQVRWLEDADEFDADGGVNRERTAIRDEAGTERSAELWTTCFTPRELRLLAERSGLVVDAVWSVTPGRYRPTPPELDQPELLLVAHRR